MDTDVQLINDFKDQLFNAEEKTGLGLMNLTKNKTGVYKQGKCMFIGSYTEACKYIFDEAGLNNIWKQYQDNFCKVCGCEVMSREGTEVSYLKMQQLEEMISVCIMCVQAGQHEELISKGFREYGYSMDRKR